MSNGKVCCILEICCPPGSAEQIDGAIEEMAHDGLGPTAIPRDVAAWFLASFDLAPKGSLSVFKQQMKAQIEKHAKQ